MRAKADLRGATPEERLRRWQFVTAATLLVGYTGYYLCRSNLSVAAPLMLEASGPEGFSRQTLGMIASAGALAYALGKFVTGVAGDFAGGRTMFLLGMIGAAAATAWFGLSSSVTFFVIAWAFNRLVQSAGWGGLVKVTSHWFPARSYGSVMGALSLSYLFGDAVCRLVLARFIAYGADWRQIFLGSAAALAGLALIVRFTLKASPEAVGLPLQTINPANVYGAAGAEGAPAGLRDLLEPYLRRRTFWLVLAMSFGLTMIREALNVWIPTYLVDVHGHTSATAAQLSALFPLAGGASTLLAGSMSDRATNRLALVWPLLAIATAALAFLASPAAATHTQASTVALVLAAFCLLGPYSLLAGAIALDFGGRRGSATAAGLIDTAGYLGAVLSGYLLGTIVERQGWPAVFLTLAGVCFASVVVVWIYTREHATVAAPQRLSV